MTSAEQSPLSVTPVEALRPDTHGHHLVLKVVEVKTILDRAPRPNGKAQKVAECLVGDETASIIFTARNGQVDTAKPDSYIELRGAKVDMLSNTMRLAVPIGGSVEAVSGHSFTPRTDFNLSRVEFELVVLPREESTAAADSPAAAELLSAAQPGSESPAAKEGEAVEEVETAAVAGDTDA